MVNLLSLFYFTLLSVYFSWPLIFNLSSKVVDLYDGLQITWIINWVIHALISDPFSLFRANIFYPYPNTLAYCELHLANALLALPLVKIFKEPVMAFNINLLAGFILTGYTCYLLVKYLTKSPLIGVISGTLLSFSTIHLNYLGHLNYFCLQYLILSIYFYFLFLENRKKKFFILFLLFSILTTLNSFFIGSCLVITILIISLIKKQLKKFIIWLLLLITVCFPFIRPFFLVSQQFNYQRPIREVIHFSLQPEDLLFPGSLSRLDNLILDTFRLRLTESWMKSTPGYLGLTFIILTGVSMVFLLTKKRKLLLKDKNLIIFLIITITALILSFGPFMHWARKTIHQPFVIPLPYVIFYYLVPGFKGFRVPSRFLLLYSLSLSVIISFVLAYFYKKLNKISRILISTAICLMVVLEFKFPLLYSPIEKKLNYPAVYYFLDSLDKTSPVLELPILNWDSYQYSSIETKRELYSTLNFRPMVNGTSAFTPPEREILMKQIMLEFPNDRLTKWLKKIKVKYLIIHGDDYQLLEIGNFLVNNKPIKDYQQLVNEVNQNRKDFKFIKKINNDLIYEIKN